MAAPEVLQKEHDLLMFSALFDHPKENNPKSRGLAIEKKIEYLESLTGTVSNRRSRRWLNDRLLMELVPRLNAQEIRGLFAPPPWGEDVPPSPFCMADVGEWDKFRNIDMDKEGNTSPATEHTAALVSNPRKNLMWLEFYAGANSLKATIIEALENSSSKRGSQGDSGKRAVLNAWHRVDSRTREALRRSFLSDLVNGFEECIRAFVNESGDGDGDADLLILHVQDPFHRLLLHGVCEFYNLVSVTDTQTEGKESVKTTKIKKKKGASVELPNMTLCQFLKMSKEGIW